MLHALPYTFNIFTSVHGRCSSGTRKGSYRPMLKKISNQFIADAVGAMRTLKLRRYALRVNTIDCWFEK
ncbi:unnamed protein product [Leptidea sinapis]|uniref:Uncharacterized protein n=1 Tax=Leptidea sinapis TaxID=189913 RepID=A0A5E4QN44_9NEOP|nr:unnamed protein product [Leptidea sinapis]